ncbi:MAG: hypothetical protein ACJ8FM_24790 [Xanthobacteraceae bacterium]
MAWGADLAHHHDVERGSERLRDFEGDRHASARQRQHNRMLELQPLQGRGELPARLAPVGKHGRRILEHVGCLTLEEKRHRAGRKMAVRANLFPRPRGCDPVPAHRLPFRAAAFGVLPPSMESPRLPNVFHGMIAARAALGANTQKVKKKESRHKNAWLSRESRHYWRIGDAA